MKRTRKAPPGKAGFRDIKQTRRASGTHTARVTVGKTSGGDAFHTRSGAKPARATARLVAPGQAWAWAANVTRSEDGEETVITLPDWPGVAAGGASFMAAITDAESALEEAALSALAHGEAWPEPTRPGAGQTVIGLTAYAAMRGALIAWADAYGHGAQAHLAGVTGKAPRHIRRLLNPDDRVSDESLREALAAAGIRPSVTFTLASESGRILRAPGERAAKAALIRLTGARD